MASGQDIEAMVRSVDSDTAAGLLAALPDETLAELMAGPLREAIVPEVFRRMPERFMPEAAGGIEAVVEWSVTGGPDGADRALIRVGGGRCELLDPGSAEPDATLEMDAPELVRLITGRSDPAEAFMSGRLKVRGDLMTAARIPTLFELPRDAEPAGT